MSAAARQKGFYLNNREIGSRYEALIAKELENRGYGILKQNYRCPLGEIDLVAADEGYLVFIEVKYRKNGSRGSAAEAVTDGKRRKICRAADYYMKQHGIFGDMGVRFDVAAIDGDKIRILKDAFPYTGAVRF